MHFHFIGKIFFLVAQLGTVTYWLVFAISFLESLAFIGAIFPGASLIVFAGFISSHSKLEPGWLIVAATFGALLSDNLSYWLGTKSNCWFKKENCFFSLKYLNKGFNFFKKYNAQSIFLARFIGPARAIVPFVAGATSLRYKTFFLWNLVSVILWAISHVFLGHFFGASLALLAPWVRRSHLFLVFTILFFGFFYFGKKILFSLGHWTFPLREKVKK